MRTGFRDLEAVDCASVLCFEDSFDCICDTVDFMFSGST